MRRPGIEAEVIDGVPIPFANADLMLKMKEKDAADRSFLEQIIRARRRV